MASHKEHGVDRPHKRSAEPDDRTSKKSKNEENESKAHE